MGWLKRIACEGDGFLSGRSDFKKRVDVYTPTFIRRYALGMGNQWKSVVFFSGHMIVFIFLDRFVCTRCGSLSNYLSLMAHE